MRLKITDKEDLFVVSVYPISSDSLVDQNIVKAPLNYDKKKNAVKNMLDRHSDVVIIIYNEESFSLEQIRQKFGV